jgi:alkylhydroperoxidase family enzyme
MNTFIPEPGRIPFVLRMAIWIAEKVTGQRMLPARLLSWYPKAAIGSGALESFTAHGRNHMEKRLLRLVRLQTAFAISCPFCIDMNAFRFEGQGVSREEFEALSAGFPDGFPESLSVRETTGLEFANLISATPLNFPLAFVARLTTEFSEREIVMLAATASQVNYWGRLIQSLGIPPAGFTDECQLSRDAAVKMTGKVPSKEEARGDVGISDV